MKSSLVKKLSSPFARLSPPINRDTSVSAPAHPQPQQIDRATLTEAAKPKKAKKSGLLGHITQGLLAASALSSVAGAGAAQAGTAPSFLEMSYEFPLTEDVTPQDLGVEESSPQLQFPSLNEFERGRPQWGFHFTSVNDFMPGSWTEHVGEARHKTPDGLNFDDDGWTAEVQLLANYQNGDTETVVGARVAMVTQTGSHPPAVSSDYEGLRTDVGEFIVQRNYQLSLNSDTTFDYGFGGGIQAIGNLGGEEIQRWYHGVAGGRLGDDLQGNQVTDSFRIMPMVTAGAKLTYAANDSADLILRGRASIPLGDGIGNVGIGAGISTEHETDWGSFTYETGATFDTTWSNARELDFHDTSGSRGGIYARVEYRPFEYGSFYGQLETGGLRDEPVLSVGFTLGGASRPRLSPFW